MILCAGEALIDMLPRQTEAHEAAFAPYPGGSVFNTAVALSRLGTKTEFFSGLSTDLFGERLASVLMANGVGSTLAHRSDRPTTLAFVALTGGLASYVFYDENTAGRMLTEADLPAIPETAKACFFGGISLAVEPCADTYAALMARAHTLGRVVMIDPNIRPGFIADESRFRARLDRMLAHSDIIKASDEDLRWLLGDLPLPTLAEALRAKGPKIVLVTQGAKGVTGFFAGGEIHVPAQAVKVVDTVGAGDTFNAGVLAGLEEAGVLDKSMISIGLPEDSLRAAMLLGVQASAVTVTRAGANPPRRDELMT